MSTSCPLPNWRRSISWLTAMVALALLVLLLTWAKVILVPLALAGFLAFVLSPATRLFQRFVGRIPAVIVVVLLASLLLGGIGYTVVHETMQLLSDLPNYKHNIIDKIRSLQSMASNPTTQRLNDLLVDISESLQSHSAEGSTEPPSEPRIAGPRNPNLMLPPDEADSATPPPPPSTVLVKSETSVWWTWLTGSLGGVGEVLAQAALTIVLLIFILLGRDELRNRLIWIAGQGQLSTMTKAIDDAGRRITRFLAMQAALNFGYGAALTLGLMVLGVPHALLWGCLAALLRYIPYLGAPLCGLLPIAMSLAIAPGWTQPVALAAYIILLELITNNFLEPWLFGQSLGVSPLGQILMTACWAFLWGPIGMILAAPLTACLLVMGKYIPQMQFLAILLSDDHQLRRSFVLYQRLAARDADDAARLVRTQLDAQTPVEVFDQMIVPTLVQGKSDRQRGGLDADDETCMLDSCQEILADLDVAGDDAANARREPVRLLLVPARDRWDAVAVQMIERLLPESRWNVTRMNIPPLASELSQTVAEERPAVVCIGSVPPGGTAQLRRLCKRLRRDCPDVHLVVGHFHDESDRTHDNELIVAAGANQVVDSYDQLRRHLDSWHAPLEHRQRTAEATVTASCVTE